MLTLGSLFDGSGGFPLGAVLNGITPVWAAEIEPFPIRVTRARFPDMLHLGDVTKIDGGQIPPVDIITGGSPCFPAGTLVLTDQGHKPIEEVKTGDLVLTHQGRWRTVTDTGSKIASTIILKGNHSGLECTENHPIYARKVYNGSRMENGVHKAGRKATEPEWIPALDMNGYHWCVPDSFEPLPIPVPENPNKVHFNDFPELTPELFYLVGRWLADGWCRQTRPPRGESAERGESGAIHICCNEEKKEALAAAIGAVANNYSVENARTAYKFRFTNMLLSRWLRENFGEYAAGKQIPAWAYGMDETYRRALLQGIMDGDGHMVKPNACRITTISGKLAQGIRFLGESLGLNTALSFCKRPETTVIEGRTVHQHDTWSVSLVATPRGKWLRGGGHAWYMMRKILPGHEDVKVYNLTVSEDNSYTANGVVVHNCQSFSIAGKRAGLSGVSGLFFEMIRIIREMRKATGGKYPRFCVMENVPGIFSSGQGDDFREVLDSYAKIADEGLYVPRPAGRWAKSGVIVADHFSLCWRTFNARFWGVPQNRQRVYIVADFGADGRRETVPLLFERQSVCGDTEKSQGEEPGDSGDCGKNASTAGGYGLNMHNSEMQFRKETAYSLSAQKPAVVAAGKSYSLNTYETYKGCMEETSYALVAMKQYAYAVPETACFVNTHPPAGYINDSDTCQTLTLNAGKGGANVPMVLENGVPQFVESHPQGGRVQLKGDTCQCLMALMGTGGNNTPLVIEEASGEEKQKAVYCHGHSGHISMAGDTLQTLNAVMNHSAVNGPLVLEQETANRDVYTLSHNSMMTQGTVNVAPALEASSYKDPTVVCDDAQDSGDGLILRRITPLECGRLQGFPDGWTDGLTEDDPDAGEISFWLDVWHTWNEMQGKKDKTEKQVKTWLKKEPADSAKYKMWGNGVALPNVAFVLSQIVRRYRETKDMD